MKLSEPFWGILVAGPIEYTKRENEESEINKEKEHWRHLLWWKQLG